jgi:hypothetical protein
MDYSEVHVIIHIMKIRLRCAGPWWFTGFKKPLMVVSISPVTASRFDFNISPEFRGQKFMHMTALPMPRTVP